MTESLTIGNVVGIIIVAIFLTGILVFIHYMAYSVHKDILIESGMTEEEADEMIYRATLEHENRNWNRFGF